MCLWSRSLSQSGEGYDLRGSTLEPLRSWDASVGLGVEGLGFITFRGSGFGVEGVALSYGFQFQGLGTLHLRIPISRLGRKTPAQQAD